ncbi:MAG: hypothetical protein AB1646_20475, partial [Thermodesulfobacteriota bacterium]
MTDHRLERINEALDTAYRELSAHCDEVENAAEARLQEQRLFRRYRALEMIRTLIELFSPEPIFTGPEHQRLTEPLMELVGRIQRKFHICPSVAGWQLADIPGLYPFYGLFVTGHNQGSRLLDT